MDYIFIPRAVGSAAKVKHFALLQVVSRQARLGWFWCLVSHDTSHECFGRAKWCAAKHLHWYCPLFTRALEIYQLYTNYITKAEISLDYTIDCIQLRQWDLTSPDLNACARAFCTSIQRLHDYWQAWYCNPF